MNNEPNKNNNRNNNSNNKNLAQRKPAPPNPANINKIKSINNRSVSANPQNAKDANMAKKPQSDNIGQTRTFDANRDGDIDIKRGQPNQNQGQTRNNPDGTYHYTGRSIKSSRQRFADPEAGTDDGSLKVSRGRDKNKNRRKDGDAESRRDGFVLSGIIKVVLYIAGVIVISGVLSYNIILIANDVFAFRKDPVSARVTIPKDADVEKISRILHENNLIKYPKIFSFYINYRKKDKIWEYEPDTYVVSSTMNYDELIASFRKKAGAREIIKVTIPEGFTIDQIIDEFAVNKGMGTRDGFIEVINNYDFSERGYRFLKPLYETELSPDRKYRLEGYLFPDTYDFYKDENEINIIMKFLDNFNIKFDQDCYDQVEILDDIYLRTAGRHITIDDIITLASIIEREAKFPEDFEPISAVFHNRLMNPASFPLLQSDATILYSYGEHKSDLTQADLAEDLPYNTYTRRGLTPSAICNPGYEAIFAALWPGKNSPYYYFIAELDGTVTYSETSAQHEAHRNRIRAERAAQGG